MIEPKKKRIQTQTQSPLTSPHPRQSALESRADAAAESGSLPERLLALILGLFGFGDGSGALLHSVRDAHAVRETVQAAKRKVQASGKSHLFFVVVGRSLQELIGLKRGAAPL